MHYPTFGTCVNIDPVYWPANPHQINGFGMDKIKGFRTVSRNDPTLISYLDAAKLYGKHVMVVVTEQSKGYVYYQADIVQIGNEPDLQSTYMTPRAYADYWNLYRNTYDGAFKYFAMAGLGSGYGPARGYLHSVWPLLEKKPDLIAVHCYDGDVNQSANEVLDLWNASVAMGDPTAIIVTEWNRAANQIWDMLAMLNGPEGLSTAWNSYYPYTTAMDSSVQGLVDANNNPTDYGASFVSAPYV
jgi:hypothetical protein